MRNKPKEFVPSIAISIKTLRLKQAMTQKELAEKLFKSESTVRMWELGKSEPDLSTLVDLARLFQVSTDYLLNHNKEMQQLHGGQHG